MTAELGGRVVGTDIDEEGLRATVADIRAQGHTADYRVADVTEKSQMDAVAAFTVERFGRIDVIVNNAGVMPLAYFADHAAGVARLGPGHRHQRQGSRQRHHGRLRPDDPAGAGPGGQHLLDLRQLRHPRIRRLQRHEGGGHGHLRLPARGGEGPDQGHHRAARPASPAPTWPARSSTTRRSSGSPPTGERSSPRTPSATTAARCRPRSSTATASSTGRSPPTELAQNVVYAINQPWGISISDITVRASGEDYVY